MKTVLIIEDNILNLKLVKTLLIFGQYKVLEADSAEKGLAIIRKDLPNMVLMDIQLPGMDGLEATRIIKNDPTLKHIPIVAITACAMDGDEEMIRGAGCDDYISKPIEALNFVQRISDILKTQSINKNLPDEVKPQNIRTKNLISYKKKILIVDDEPRNIKLLQAQLFKNKYEVLEAYSGKTALEMVYSQSIDLILLDVMMPEINGYEVTSRLKNNPDTSDIPIILVTALDQTEHKIQGLNSGADEFLSKPVDRTELNTRVQSLLRLKTYQEQLTTRTRCEDEFIDSCIDEQTPLDLRPVILHVEDNTIEIELVTQYLKNIDCHLLSAGNGEEALEIIQRQKIDLLLLDIILPGMDGFEIFNRIKTMEHAKDIQVIIISSVDNMEARLRGLKLGADDYLIKPIQADILKARIATLLEKKAYLDGLTSRFESALEAAVSDKLTNLYNHTYFKRFLTTEIKRAVRQKYSMGLIMADIDNFKQYNDTRGHLAGDMILRETAGLVRANIREVDLAARYGGEEFAVVLPYADNEQVLNVAERIRKSVAKHSFIMDNSSRVDHITMSLGIAFCPQEADSLNALIQRADARLYHAKKHGKNRVCSQD